MFIENKKIESIAVCLVTYNEEKYIAQAIESVLMQNVSVPYICYIGEDCSSDSTRNIVLEYQSKYPGKIKVLLHNENQGLVKNTIAIFKEIQKNNHSYIAMLDGDDYWLDNFKLQKELDFLTSHYNYGLVHTNIALLWNDNKMYVNFRKNITNRKAPSEIKDLAIGNCSVLFRTALLKYVYLDDFITWRFMSVDYALYQLFAKYTKFGFLDDLTAVWRRGHSSLSNPNDISKEIAYVENAIQIWHYLDQLFSKFEYNEEAATAFRDWQTFNIAFKFKNYELAKTIVEKGNLDNDKGLIFELKKKVTKYRLSFTLWCLLKNLKSVFNHYTIIQ